MTDTSCHSNLTSLGYSSNPRFEIVNRLQVVWGTISFILGLTGNVFVMYAIIVHNAIKLDKMSVWIVKNLAVADICSCVFVLLPTLLLQYGKLNDTILFVRIFVSIMACYQYSFFLANAFLVNFLSINKLVRCMFPLRNLDSSRRQRITVTIGTVFICLLPTLWLVYVISGGFQCVREDWRYIDYLGAIKIGGSFPNKATIGPLRQMIGFVLGSVLIILPCITLMIFNAALIIFAVKKSNSGVNKRNLLIVVFVTSLFLLSILPYFLLYIPPLEFSPEYKEMSWSFLYSSTWTNPFIYFAVNPTFRKFVQDRLKV